MNYKILTFIFAVSMVVLGARDESFEKSLVQIIQGHGYNVKVYRIRTEDKYILTVFRLPSRLKNPKIAFLMHGLLASAADYIPGGRDASLPYLLAENGFDVWLGNARGNIFSQTHETLAPTSPDFWNFSFHEIGMYDVPAIIDYALNKVNGTSLTYVGHSQGTTALLILLSMRPEYNSKISKAFLMAPVAFMRFPVFYVKILVSSLNEFEDVINANQLYGVISLSRESRSILAYSCHKNSPSYSICKNIYMLIGGDNPDQYNEDIMPIIHQFYPGSASYKQILHYGQIAKANGSFLLYDHKRPKNLQLYNQPVPPTYPLSNVNTHLYVLYGSNDTLANPKDVEYLLAKLKKNRIDVTKMNDWNHFDFLYGKDVQKKLYDIILRKIKLRA